MTFVQAVEEIAKARGREMNSQRLGVEEYSQILRDHQVPEELIWLAVNLFAGVWDGQDLSG